MALAICALLFVALPGCGGGQWEITAENRGDAPGKLVVTLDGNSSARVDELAKGNVEVLLRGKAAATIREVEVIPSKSNKTTKLHPGVELAPGKRYHIVVEADGEVKASLKEK